MNRTLSLMAITSCLAAAPVFAAQRSAPEAVPAHAPRSAQVVALVNGIELTERDLRNEMQELFPFYQVHGGRVPAKAEPEIRSKALDRLVLTELLFQEAKRRKLQVSPLAVVARMDKLRKQFRTRSEFDRAVAAQFGSEAEFQKKVLRALMVEKLWDQEVVRPSRVSEADARSHYSQNRDHYVRPESVRLQTISFQFPEKATPAERNLARTRAEEILPQAKAAQTPQAFGALAERFSTDDWRVMNGDHGWVHRGTLEPELEIAFRMKPGETSGIITSRDGFHILRVSDYRKQAQLSYTEVREKVRKSLEEERLKQRREKLEQALRRTAKIETP
ncbi:MAG: peptidylprolyl isomerase [Acidobacteria bacterium]|nr:peptidylprolyl isomerase [Acidobacteriota bacterium]